MRIASTVPKQEYLAAMRTQIGSFWTFGSERFVGTVLGPFFSVTYCSGSEWNRRITNEKNRAIGYVRSVPEGTEVRCVRLAGMTNPVSLFLYFILYFLMVCYAAFDVGTTSYGLLLYVVLAAVCTALTALITALTDSLTERGQEGHRIVTAFLHDPRDFYGNIVSA